MTSRPSSRHGGRTASTRDEDAAPNRSDRPRVPTTVQRRRRIDALIWGGIVLSVALHFLLLTIFPEFETPDVTSAAGEIELAEVPPEIDIPAPPDAIQRPGAPVVAESFEVDPDITIAPTTFAENPVEDLPPPPEEGTSGKDIYDAPTFTPYSVAPDLMNRAEAAEAVVREWPRLLKDSGIEGVVTVWILIDEEGRVTTAQISESSGFREMDEAALRATRAFRFSPAMSREEKIPVWIQLPVIFSTDSRMAG